MRVLILTAILAYASAAPSGVAPLAVLPAVPTIDPGDIQAAAINAQVQVEDQARAAADSARELTERVVEDNNEKVVEADSQIKEKTEEAFWSTEDKKWQTLNAVQTAEAKLDGAVASNADAIARSALGGIIVPSYIASPLLQAPVVSPLPTLPVSPVVYAAPGLLPIKELEKEKEKQKDLVKTAAPEKEGLKLEEEKKTEEKKQDELQKPVITPILTPLVAPTIKLGQPWIAPVGAVAPISPVAPIASVAYLPQPLLTPVLKTQW